MDPHLLNIFVMSHIIDSLDQHQAHASFIGLMSGLVCRGLEFQDTVALYLFGQLLQLSIHKY